MALVTMDHLLRNARAKSMGAGAFNVGNLEMVKGAVQAAEEAQTPIILQIAEVRLGHSPLDYIGPMMVQAAKDASVDIAVHFDHGKTQAAIHRALELGFTSVMYDGSGEVLEENIRKTQSVVQLARHYGASVEAELGRVGGSEDGTEGHTALYTDVSQAVQFCKETDIDALAIAIGNAHGTYKQAPALAFDVLQEIREQVEIPLVLHGGSGITDEEFQKLIRTGITKVNIATASFNAVSESVAQHIRAGTEHSYFTISEAMVRGTYQNILHHINVFRCGA